MLEAIVETGRASIVDLGEIAQNLQAETALFPAVTGNLFRMTALAALKDVLRAAGGFAGLSVAAHVAAGRHLQAEAWRLVRNDPGSSAGFFLAGLYLQALAASGEDARIAEAICETMLRTAIEARPRRRGSRMN